MVANIFSSIWANRMKLQMQSDIQRLQRSLSRITREISTNKTQLNRAKRMETNQIKQQFSIFSQSGITAMAINSGKFDAILTNGVLDFTKAQANESIYNEYNQAIKYNTMMMQNQQEQQLAALEEYYETQNEMLVTALEDEQADIEAEIETKKNQVQMYEGMQKTSQEFAKNNIQNTFQA